MLRRALAFLGVLAGLWAVWEGYKAFGEAGANRRTMLVGAGHAPPLQ
jgi:hypothetical protein